jgi:hypothetical protein
MPGPALEELHRHDVGYRSWGHEVGVRSDIRTQPQLCTSQSPGLDLAKWAHAKCRQCRKGQRVDAKDQLSAMVLDSRS